MYFINQPLLDFFTPPPLDDFRRLFVFSRRFSLGVRFFRFSKRLFHFARDDRMMLLE